MAKNKVQFVHITVGPAGIKIRFVRKSGWPKNRQVRFHSDKIRVNQILTGAKIEDLHTELTLDGQETEVHNS